MVRFQDIQAVTFDVGETLIDPWPSVGHVYSEVATQHGLRGLDCDRLNRQFARAWRSRTSFDYSRAAWKEVVAETFNHYIEPGETVHFFEELYDRFAEPDVWRIHADALPAIEMLLDRGFELGLISNWDERLRPLLNRLKLDRYFRVIIISQEIGFCKPSPVIFDEAVRKFTCAASSVLHVGDGEVEDFQGARDAGLQSVLLKRSGVETGDKGRIRSLADLRKMFVENNILRASA